MASNLEITPYIKTLFMGFVERQGAACWPWIGTLDRAGYGLFRPGKAIFKTILAHRVHWIMVYGPMPDGMVLDHLCRNRACVRLSHLELVSSRTNTLRGYGPAAVNARKVIGNCGHPLAEVVTRTCLICRNSKRKDRRRSSQARSGRSLQEAIAPLSPMERIAKKHFGFVPDRFRGDDWAPEADNDDLH